MKSKTRKTISIVLNVALVILGFIGLYYTIKNNKKAALLFYTQQSNYISIIASILYLCFIKTRRTLPRIVRLIKYLSVLNLTVTFLVVIFILTPTLDFNYNWLLLQGSNLYFHVLCPILALISFLFFERYRVSRKDAMIVTEYTILYALVLTVLNMLEVVEGPYPFLLVYKNTPLMSVLYFIIIIGGCYGISMLLCKIKERIIVKYKIK